MYLQHFGFKEYPFSIVPSSRFLYHSRRHNEAIFQLQAGLGEGGGFAMLTGEVGTGKTTVAKAILKDLGEQTKAGLILNPTFSSIELLEAICDEFGLGYPDGASLKQFNQLIKEYLKANHDQGFQTLLVIDEAQHLSAEVLEQLRLLTNLETESQKLLKVLLIGQPELQQKLQMPQLRQLAQRITGRYHLLPLNQDETRDYIRFRLSIAGGSVELFSSASVKTIAKATLGIPRLINLVCDASLKKAYGVGELQPSNSTVQQASEEVMSFQTGSIPNAIERPRITPNRTPMQYVIASLIGVTLAAGAYIYTPRVVSSPFQLYIESLYPAVEDTVEQVEVFPVAVADSLLRSGSLQDGLANLYRVWGYQASLLDSSCNDNPQSLFHCEKSKASLSELEGKGEMVLLALELEGKPSYAVLYGLSATQLTLYVNDNLIEFDREWLPQIWGGEYYRIWQGYWDQTLKLGMSGEAVARLDEHLSLLMGLPPSQSELFDDRLKEKVELFQRWQNLEVDGIAGEKTLLLLEQLSQPQAPKLNGGESNA